MGNKLTIEKMKELAISRDGECVSDIYIGSGEKLLWKCKYEHTWMATYSNINGGHWCPTCAGQAKILIEDIRKIAIARGGSLLSNEYKNAKSKLLWQCKQNHQWEASYDSIKQGAWCHFCKKFKSEEICRKILELIFNKKFPKQRPRWLKNRNNNQLELDGFCEELNIAFEHNGFQHYKIGIFSSSQKQLINIQNNDIDKLNICNTKGIKLLIIPDLNVLKLKNLIQFIEQELTRLNINFTNLDVNYKNIDFSDCYNKDNTKYDIKFLHDIAKSRNGKCLSSNLSFDRRYEWYCNIHDYVWITTIDKIIKGNWCIKCGIDNRKYTIIDMQTLANKFNGFCISKIYTGMHDMLEWKCKNDHIFLAKPHTISFYNKWCSLCPLKIKLIEMQHLAKSQGGMCLSDTYVNNNTKLEWQCKDGHKWMSRPRNIIDNWCPRCKRKNNTNYKKSTINDMQIMAAQFDGVCLSDTYINNDTKLTWRCKENHIFEKKSRFVTSEQWCKICAKQNRKKFKQTTTEAVI